MMINQNLIPSLTETCWQAADAIMAFYDEPCGLDPKADGSPLTKADLAAHHVIVSALKQLTPNIPIISEESYEDDDLDFLDKTFWLVDPLDGTKEFIKKNGEFTVNIALIEHKQPVLGFVCTPALEELYVGMVGKICYKTNRAGKQTELKVATPHDGIIVVGSRSHGDPSAMEQFLQGKKVKSFIATGSSLKFCRIAEGKAHLYPRLGRTMEWDTAAGHAVLLAAGGSVKNIHGEKLQYGKQGIDNPYFVASYNETT